MNRFEFNSVSSDTINNDLKTNNFYDNQQKNYSFISSKITIENICKPIIEPFPAFIITNFNIGKELITDNKKLEMFINNDFYLVKDYLVLKTLESALEACIQQPHFNEEKNVEKLKDAIKYFKSY